MPIPDRTRKFWYGECEHLSPDLIGRFDSAEDVIDCLTEIGEDERAALGGRARQRVLAEHTAERRFEQLEEEVAGTMAE